MSYTEEFQGSTSRTWEVNTRVLGNVNTSSHNQRFNCVRGEEEVNILNLTLLDFIEGTKN